MGHMRPTLVRRFLASAGGAVLAATALLATPSVMTPLPIAGAASCPDVEVVFARGREEPAGTGIVGTAFVNALRAKSSADIGYYPVDYDAEISVDQGAKDMSSHIQYMAANCPNTRLVLGGYSLGATVTDMVLATPGPFFGFSNPLPLGSDSHIAAVAFFGNGARKVLGYPVSEFNPTFTNKIIDLCNAADPVCSPSLDVQSWPSNWSDHLQAGYLDSGLVNQAATFAAAKL
ncbi:cutinase family protein [soil metagenome]